MIYKALLSTHLRKKARSLLLLFSIAVCSSLLFANEGFQSTCERMVYDAGTRWAGNSELYLTPKQLAGAPEWIDVKSLEPYSDSFEYVYEFVRGRALYAPDSDAMHYFSILGVDIDQFHNHNPLTLKSGDISDFYGDCIIIGEAYATEYDVGAGDNVVLEIAGVMREYRVAGVSRPSGLFLRDTADGGYLLAPKDTLAELLGGECNLVFMKLRNPDMAKTIAERLTIALPQYNAHIGIDYEIIRAETANYVLPFRFSGIAVILMSVFIIFSSFNLIIIERINILGIVRSAGCTRAKTNRILLSESAVIGIAGGAFGSVLGIGVLHIIKNTYFHNQAAVLNAPVILGIWPFAFTISVSAVVTVLCAILPILRVTREPVKNIIQNDFQKRLLKNTKYWPIGIALLTPCAIAPFFAKNTFTGMIAVSLCTVLALAGLNTLIPALRACCVSAVKKLPLSSEVALGIKNTGDFKQLVNNIRLFASTIALMLFMATLFHTLGTDLRNSYRRENYDLIVVLRETDETSLSRLTNTPGVYEIYGVYETYAPLTSHATFLNAVIGLENSDFFDYSPATLTPDSLTALDFINNGKNIVTTCILRDKLGLRLGDLMTIQYENGPASYVVTGFVDTNWGIGHVGYISADNYTADAAEAYYSKIFVRASADPETVKNNILRSLSRDALSVQTKREIEAANADKVIGIFNAINTYAYLAVLIGLAGIANNIVACFLGRRRNLALYRCIGMSSAQMGRMLTAEAACIGVIGVLSGLSIGLLMARNVPYVVGMLWGDVALAIPASLIFILCLAGIAAMLLASVIPTVKGRNISIIETLHYE